MTDETSTAVWKCNNCGATDNVRNGFCKECGAVQTTPVSDKAKVEAGIKADGDPDPADEQQQQEE